jgi:hypothetical protein
LILLIVKGAHADWSRQSLLGFKGVPSGVPPNYAQFAALLTLNLWHCNKETVNPHGSDRQYRTPFFERGHLTVPLTIPPNRPAFP